VLCLHYEKKILQLVLRIVAISIPFDVLAIILFHVNKAFKIVKYEVVLKYITENCLKFGLTALLFVFGITYLGPVIGYSISIILISITILILTQKKVFPIMGKKIPYKFIHRKMFSFSWPLVLSNFLIMIMLWTDTLMISFFRSTKEVGIYNSAIPTAQMLYVIPYAMAFLIVPTLTDYYAKKDQKGFNSLYKRITRWVLIINMAPLLVFVFLSKEIMSTLFGSQYLAASSSLIFISIGYFIGHLSTNANHILIIKKRTKLVFRTMLIIRI
jgi:O-antigen/teichoic acid export membrane protein